MNDLEGGCLCGKVRYTSSSKPLTTVACHCTDCRKQSGTAFSIIIGISSDSLTISGDSLRSFDDIGSSGKPIHRFFCNACGSPLYSQVEAAPDVVFLKAGSLDNTDWVEVTAEIWCDSKVSWSQLEIGLKQFPRSPRE